MTANATLAGHTPHKLTVETVLAFARSGAFDRLPRLELLDGMLYEMSPQTSAHVRIRNRMTFALQRKIIECGLSLEALSDATIIIDPRTAPEPDIIVCNDPNVDGFYPASSVLIAIEVALASLRTDLGDKRRLYASVAIPEYWVIDVAARRIHQFWHPSDGDYAETRITDFGAPIGSESVTGVTIATDHLVAG